MNALNTLMNGLTDASVRIVDLTNPLSSTTPTLKLPEPFVNLIDFSLDKVSEYNEPGPYWKHHNIHTGEHVGTHIDAPTHWVSGRDGHDVSTIPPERLIGPAIVLDVRAQVEEDPDFLLEVDDLRDWELKHGALPENGWLLLRTGWDRFSHDQKSFLNTDDTGSHTPGISAEAARAIAEETPLSGIGVETVGIDAGRGAELDPPFPVHYHLLGNDKYGITSLQNLDQLPAVGTMLVVAPLPIVGGTASPSRVFALVEADA